MKANGITDYSDVVAGEAMNWDWPVRFDVTDGVVGITQGSDRVLLSPAQWKALVAFMASRHPREVSR